MPTYSMWPIKVFMDHNRAKMLFPLRPTPLEKADRVGGMESMKMEPWNRSYFLPHVFFQIIFIPQSISSSLSVVFVPFIPPAFLFATSFVSVCHPSETLLVSRSPPHFPIFLNVTIPFCAWSKSSPLLSPALSALFWAQHLHGKPHSSDTAGKEVAANGRCGEGGKGDGFSKRKFSTRRKERRFYSQLQGTWHSLLCKF